MSRTRRSGLTMASGLASSVLVAATSFATAPYLLDRLGADRYGAFRAALGWFGLLGLLEFGVGGGLQALAARALAAGRPGEVAVVVRAGVRAYGLLAGLTVVVALGLAVALPGLIRVPPALVGDLRLGSALYSLTFLLLPLASFRALAEAEQRGYLVNLLLAAQTLTAAGAAVALAGLGWGLVGQFGALLIGGLVFHLGLARDGLRRHPGAVARPASAPGPGLGPGPGGALWRLSWPAFIFNLSGRLGLTSDELVIGGLLGPAAVASFFLTQRVIAVVGAQMLAVGGATWAGLADLHFRGEHVVFRHRLVQLTRATAILGATLLVPVAVRNRDLVALWVGPASYGGEAITYLAACNTWGQGLVALWLWPLSAAGLVRRALPAVVTATTVNLAVGLGATALVGLPGPLIGTSAALLGLNWWWSLRLLRRHFGTESGLLLKAAGGPALLGLLYGGVLLLVARHGPSPAAGLPRWAGLLALAGWLGLASLGYLALAYALVIPRADRAEWLGRLRARRSPIAS